MNINFICLFNTDYFGLYFTFKGGDASVACFTKSPLFGSVEE